MEIQIFNSSYSDGLVCSVNSFISSRDIEVSSIQYSTYPISRGVMYSAMIVYTIKK